MSFELYCSVTIFAFYPNLDQSIGNKRFHLKSRLKISDPNFAYKKFPQMKRTVENFKKNFDLTNIFQALMTNMANDQLMHNIWAWGDFGAYPPFPPSAHCKVANIIHTPQLLLLSVRPWTQVSWYPRKYYVAFSHHYQGSVDIKTVNIQHTVAMYFLVFTGTRVDVMS